MVANLEAFTESELVSLVQAYRQRRDGVTAQPTGVSVPEPQSDSLDVKIKEQPVNPLQMDIDEEEIEYEPDRLNLQVSTE